MIEYREVCVNGCNRVMVEDIGNVNDSSIWFNLKELLFI